MDALDMLTLDCWREILNRVRSPEDLKACSETCIIFKELLWKKTNAFLFHLILPMLVKYLPYITSAEADEADSDDESDPEEEPEKAKEEQGKNEDGGVDEGEGLDEDDDEGEDEDEDEDEGEDEVDWTVLFNCRVVCRDWCKSIDRLGDSSSFGHIFESKYQFDSGETTERFLSTFSTHVGNPFVGRRVAIEHRSTLLIAPPQEEQNVGVPRDEILHIEKIRQLLSRFGNGIRALQLLDNDEHDIEENIPQHLALCKNISTVLSQMPNLCSLRLKSLERARFGDFLGVIEDDEQTMHDELSAYITANPLPPLPHLDGLEVLGINLVMTRSILEKYSSQLKSLTISWHPSRFLKQLPQFSCLKELDFRFLDTCTPLWCLKNLHSPLEKLNLEVMHNMYQLPVWPIDEIFRNIQHLPIRELEIMNFSNVFLGESAQKSTRNRTCHESISKVYIVSGRDTVSLNLLAYCPKLEIFGMFHRPPYLQQILPSGHPTGVAELYDVTDLIKEDHCDLYESSIWETIPSLKKFTLGDFPSFVEDYYTRGTHYHRKIYEENRGNMKDVGCLT